MNFFPRSLGISERPAGRFFFILAVFLLVKNNEKNVKIISMPILYIVATPIGNLEDISKRALRILSEVDLILCEDTRTTKKLLNHFGIKTPTLSYHQHSKLTRINQILEELKKGKNLALVCDAGTPGISDPGNKLIQIILKELKDKVKVVPVPGPSAITCSASVAGFSMDRFLFLGFLPQKKKRKKFLEKIVFSEYPVVFYESPYRILKTLEELKEVKDDLEVVVCRELTKMFETIYRGKIDEVLEKIKEDKIKGEFVVIVNR